jgi:tetratricopeptide (TPR) repeat protein
MHSSRDRSFWILLFLGALAVRVLHVLFFRDCPFFDRPVVDSKTYVHTALAIAGGGGSGRGVFWQPPLYPWFLAGIFRLFGPGLLLPRLVQAALGAASCVLVGRLGEAAFPGTRTGRVAALAAALYGPLVFFDGELLAPVLIVFLDLLLLLWLVTRADSARPAAWLVPGGLLGLSALARPNVLAVAPLLAGWILLGRALGRGAAGTRRALAVLLLATGIAAIVLPVTVRNRVVGGDWVAVSYNGGINFYIGNNPDYDRTVASRPGYRWEELTGLADRAGAARPAERSRFYYGRALRFIAEEPLAWAALTLRKMYLFANGFEIPRNVDLYALREYSPVLWATLWDAGLKFPFGLVLPLALLGLLRPGAPRRPPAPLVLFAAGYALTVVAFFVTGRYRIPVVPVLLLFAVRGGAGWLAALGGGRRKRLALETLALGTLLVACNLPPGVDRSVTRAEVLYFRGTVELEQGDKEAAGRSFLRASRLDPRNAEAFNNLGNLRQERGDAAGALDAYRSALEADPDHVSTLVNLSALLLRVGRDGEAGSLAERALSREPTNWRAHLVMAEVQRRRGNDEGAKEHRRRALELGAPGP